LRGELGNDKTETQSAGGRKMKVSLFGGNLATAIPGKEFRGKKFRIKAGVVGMKYNVPVSFTEDILKAMEKGVIRMVQIRISSKERMAV
jgi:hypothetical protein